MTTPATRHTWMARVALRSSASSDLPLAPPKAASCVLALLGHAHPQAHLAAEEAI